jgi:predicted metal-dependent phosphoesterase TrpH
MEKYCDFHTHSNASDGSDTPAGLMAKAADAGLGTVALTDHDTVAGLDEAEREAERQGIGFIPGVELSVIHDQGNMHMLCYLMDRNDRAFRAVLARLQEARGLRNERMLASLEEVGKPLSMDELEALAGDGQVGRPHFARAMVQRGYVSSVSEAFELYLKRGAPAYVPKSILSAEDAIKVIHDAGGIAVLAHPCSLRTASIDALEEIIARLARQGLDGVECHYSEHGKTFTEKCVGIANKYGLVITGGSDYHGKAKPHIGLGRGKGNLRVPCSCANAIMARKHERKGG